MPGADSTTGFKPLKETALFSPLKIGALNLEHRIVQAPLTRMRGVKESDGVFVPKQLHVEYYSQRASKGGLQLTEATDIAKYVSSPDDLKAQALTLYRLVAIQAFQACLLNRRLQAGRRSLTRYTQKAVTYSANYGILDERVRHRSEQEHQPSAQVTCQWKVVGLTAWRALTTRLSR
jgi:hypothetical protein